MRPAAAPPGATPKLRALVHLSLSLLAVAALGAAAHAAPKGVKILLLHTNDHHGRDKDHRVTGGHMVGGLAMRAALVARLRAEHEGWWTLLLDAGDTSTGPCEPTVLGGRPSLQAQGLMGYDAMVLGNHEFDVPIETRLAELAKVPYPAISANVVWKATGKPVVEPYVILSHGGASIAILGLTTPDTPILSARGNDPRLEFKDPIETAKRLVPKLRERADAVVVLSHCGIDTDRELAREVPGVDLVVGGHSNVTTFAPEVIGKTRVVQAGYEGRYLGVGELELVPGGGMGVSSYRLVEIPPASKGGLEPDPRVARLVDELWASVRDRCSGRLGEALEIFDRQALAGPGTGSTAAHLVADAMRWRTGVDVAFENEGGVRADLPAGEVTMGLLKSMLPFGNTIVKFRVTGAQLKELLRAVAALEPGAKAMLHGSGIRWTIHGREVGEVLVGGRPLDVARWYTVATNSFIARGGDGYAFFKGLATREDTGVVLVRAVADYVRSHSPISPDPTPRVTRLPPPPRGT